MNIEEIEELLKYCTEGKWFVIHDTDICVESPEGSGEIDQIAHTSRIYDAQLIALAPELARLARSLAQERDKYREALLTITVRAYAKRGHSNLYEELSGIAQSALKEE